jgi:hypothetical protein
MPKHTPPQIWKHEFSHHPLFAGFESACDEFEGSTWPTLSLLNSLAHKKEILNAQHITIQFSEQDAPKGQRAYESQIFQSGMVPTRAENWHDLLNACAWLMWPKLKSALNHIHCLQFMVTHTKVDRAINNDLDVNFNDVNFLGQHHDKPKASDPFQRNGISDTATLFDESGAVLIGPDPRLAQWLVDHDWQNAFVTHRHLWQSHRLLVVGHALLEKTLNPYPGMIAKVLYQPYPASTPDEDLNTVVKTVDALLAQRWLNQTFTKPSDLFAVPVLGVPGVDALNESSRYYDNRSVFRPLRSNI